MDYKSMLADLFQEEDAARHMARQLMSTANKSREAAAREKPSLLEFLRGRMERHMAYEEASLFPRLMDRGLGPEVDVAKKHHDAIRELTQKLDATADLGEIAQAVFDVARLMLHHTNFEGDYIYPELDSDDWRDLLEETVH